MPRQRALPLLMLAVLLCANGCKVLQQTSLLQKMRSQYYSLADAGITEYHCDVTPDWATLYTSVNKEFPGDTPWQRYLQQTHLTFSAPVSGTATVKWIAPSTPPPAGFDGTARAMQDSYQAMVGGFLEAWGPSLNGTMLPSLPISPITPRGGGYALTEHDMQDRVTFVTMDSAMRITHLSTMTPTLAAEINTTFTPSPHGLMLTQMDSRTHQPPTAPEEHVITRTTYATIQGVQIPSSISIVTERSHIPMAFSHCGITR